MKWMVALLFSVLFGVVKAQDPTPLQEQYATDSIASAPDSPAFSHSGVGIIEGMLKFAESYIGAPYAFGSTGPKSFDCSGYVRHVHSQFNIELPHGSATQATLCKKIKRKEVQPGDLVFFSGRKISKNTIGHVAMVHRIEGEEIYLIHATVQSGVIIESLDRSAYFSKRFIHFGRLSIAK